MTVGTFHDVEGAIRDWLAADPGVAAAAPGGVWFGIPARNATFPQITMSVVGGTTNDYAPLDYPLVQFAAWGAEPAPAVSGKITAEAAVRAVQTAIFSLEPGTVIDAGVVCLGAVFVSRPIWSPAPPSDRARYLLTARFTVRSGT